MNQKTEMWTQQFHAFYLFGIIALLVCCPRSLLVAASVESSEVHPPHLERVPATQTRKLALTNANILSTLYATTGVPFILGGFLCMITTWLELYLLN
jgi:hypothetical protein